MNITTSGSLRAWQHSNLYPLKAPVHILKYKAHVICIQEDNSDKVCVISYTTKSKTIMAYVLVS